MGAPDFIPGGAPREEPFKHYEINPSSNAGTDGQGCGWIRGDDAADPKCDSLQRFGGRNRAEGRCRHRPRNHTSGKNLSARMGGIRRSAAIEPESRTAGTASCTGADRPGIHRHVDQGFRTWRSQVRRPEGVDHYCGVLDARGLRSAADRGQRPIQEFLHLERIGGDAASGEATRCGLHEEFQNQQPACGAGEPRP